MTNKTLQLSEQLHSYLLGQSLREDALLQRLRSETAALPQAHMQIAPEQGQLMALLVRLMNAGKALEIGVFTGYSSLCIARALTPLGRLVACDIDPDWTAIARRYWQEAGVAAKIELRLAPALDTLAELLAEEEGSFDFAFIDADKKNYEAYYEGALRLLRPGGLAVIDNVLWSGRVADPAADDPDTRAIRAFNAKLRDDKRVDLSLLPIADGLTLARKREQSEHPGDAT
jgi:predicted O-methyltransferase YrrM